MRCERCDDVVEKPREVYARPTCYECLPPPPPLPILGCPCEACAVLKRRQAERKFARIRTERENARRLQKRP
jgi:hypothetical protein